MAICKETVIAAMPGDGSTGAEGLAFPHKLVTAWPQCGPSGTVIVTWSSLYKAEKIVSTSAIHKGKRNPPLRLCFLRNVSCEKFSYSTLCAILLSAETNKL